MNKPLLLAGLLLLSLPAPLQARDLKLFTGAKNGTYHKVGQSLSELARKNGLALSTQASPGSLSNALALALHQADLALCQYDVLQRLASRPNGRSLAMECRLVMPLYYEELHLLVRRDARIGRLSDLKGKTIAVGRPSSGSCQSALNLLAVAGLKRSDVFFDHATPALGLRRLRAGKVDAMLYTGGQPVGLLQRLKKGQAKGVTLYSFGRETLARMRNKNPVLQIRRIPAGRYPAFQQRPVLTVAVPCLLLASREVAAKDVAKLCRLVFQNQAALAKAHPKWGEAKVSLARVLASRSAYAHAGAKQYFLGQVPTLGSLRLSAGMPGGTYRVIADGIRRAAGRQGLKVVPLPSQGSDINTMSLLMGQADLGLTQLDSLLFLNLKHPRVANTVRVALPLYPEEVHVVVRREAKINSLADLKGKRIHAGPPTSGSLSTANFLLVMNHIDPKREVRLDYSAPAVALRRLLKGDLDALFITGGRPLGLLSKLDKAAGKTIKLLTIPPAQAKALRKEFRGLGLPMPYYLTTIPAGSYPWQAEAVQTLATPSLLLASSQVSANRVATLVGAILARAPHFKHAKWTSTRFPMVRRVLSRLPRVLRLHGGTQDYLVGRLRKRVQVHFQRLSAALEAFRKAEGAFPKQLTNLKPKYVKELPRDPWGRTYRYRAPGRWGAGYEITSLGADGKVGGAGRDQDLATAEGSAWILTNPGRGAPAREKSAGKGGVD